MFLTSNEIQNNLELNTVSSMTIRRRITEQTSFQSYWTINKPEITKKKAEKESNGRGIISIGH